MFVIPIALTLLLSLITPFTVFAETTEINAGFVEGIWFGHDPIIAEETTRIYVALRNNTDTDLTGTVRFSDNGARIGSANVSALPGRIIEAWIDWKPAYGDHTVSATLGDIRVYEIGESPTSAIVESTLAERTLFVDYDTDEDGLLNKSDLDDDNDTVSDELERERGTDPLTPNPIQGEVQDTSENSEEKNSTDTEDVTNISPIVVKSSNTAPVTGLEQYVSEGTLNTVLSSITDTISETKQSIDSYRSERTDAVKPYFESESAATSSALIFSIGTSSPDSGATLATITRSYPEPEKKNFVETIVGAGQALLSGIYTFILWIVSKILTYPAVLELILLLFIIYMIYRTARRFGGRPNR